MGDTIKDRTLDFVRYKGITIKSFEEICGLSSGYINSMRKGFGPEKLNNVLKSFPELSREWLLYGEGQMLKTQSNPNQMVLEDNHTLIAGLLGNSNYINNNGLLTKIIEEFSAQRDLNNKYQEQINRLLKIIEQQNEIISNLQNNKNDR